MKTGDISIIIFTLSLKWVKTELFSATADLISLIETHDHVIKSIQNYLKEEENRLEILRKRLNMFKREHKEMKLQEHYVGNPINAFTLIHSLTEELDVMENYAGRQVQRGSLRFPVKEDWEGSAVALWRLQITYNLNLTLLAAGKLQGTYSHGNKVYAEESSPMSTSALFAVGRVVYAARDFENALQWFFEALQNYYRRDPQDSFLHDDSPIIDYIRHAYHGVGDFKNAIKWTEKLIEKQPLVKHLRDSVDLYRLQLEQNSSVPYIPQGPLSRHGLSAETVHVYPKLCRGEIPLPEHKRKNLHCHYKHDPSPFLRLAPIKTELLHLEPKVYLFYDTISDAEIQYLQDKSQNLLQRATVNKPDSGSISVSYRISKSAWLHDVESSVVARISKRVADFTGLDTASAEALQVANYGIGGHYDPHYDFLPKSTFQKFSNGNRIGTVMFYMSDVEQGGATAFTEIHLTVFPVKNAAIFWYNLLPSCEPDFRTKHAACPVLRGSKWGNVYVSRVVQAASDMAKRLLSNRQQPRDRQLTVPSEARKLSNKWLHESGQEFLQTCDLEYQENSYYAADEDVKYFST